MAITLSTAARNAACNGIVDLLDAGAPPGNLKLYTAAAGLLATMPLANTAFGNAGAVNPGEAVAAAIAEALATGAGTVTNFTACNAAGTVVFSGSCAVAGADLLITNAVLAINDPINVTSWTFTVPAA